MIYIGTIIDVLQSIVDGLTSLWHFIEMFFVTILNAIPVLIQMLTQAAVFSNTIQGYCAILIPFILCYNIKLVTDIIRMI